MSGYVIACFEGPDGTPVAVSAANPLPTGVAAEPEALQAPAPEPEAE